MLRRLTLNSNRVSTVHPWIVFEIVFDEHQVGRPQELLPVLQVMRYKELHCMAVLCDGLGNLTNSLSREIEPNMLTRAIYWRFSSFAP
jgi:hypothetical protein